MQRNQRISREITKITKYPPKGISCSPKDAKFDILEAQILGPEGTPYESFMFNLEIHVPESYPFRPPNIRFVTKIYHPNIDDTGRICLDLMQMPPKGNWKPTMTVEGLLIAVRMLMETPNTKDPLMAEIAHEFENNKAVFMKKAKEYCQTHTKI